MSLSGMLRNGGGMLSVADFGEAASAVARGADPSYVLFDSPAKTVPELRWALEVGLTINADSLAELERIQALLTERGPSRPSRSRIGLRVNPIVQGGAISIFAVSASPDRSVSITSTRDALGTQSTAPS